MLEEIPRLTKNLQEIHGHIFYCFQDIDRYVENAITYAVSGVEQGSHILFVENYKLISLIQKRLESILSKNQMANINFYDNFDFYFSKNTFNPVVITEQLVKTLTPYVKNNISVRTWGHVEWRDIQNIYQKIGQYENNAEQFINSKNITSLCAYDADRMTEELKEILLQCHEFFMTDNELVKI